LIKEIALDGKDGPYYVLLKYKKKQNKKKIQNRKYALEPRKQKIKVYKREC
jgi:hypothetical protein